MGRPYMFEGLPKAGHVEAVSIQNVAQNFNSLFLQLLYDLKKQRECCDQRLYGNQKMMGLSQ